MKKRFVRIISLALAILATTGAAARADVCVAVDTAADTLSPLERSAAVLLVRKGFEAAGETTVAVPCEEQYVVSRVMNFDMTRSQSYAYGYPSGATSSSAASWLKLEGLHFTHPEANRSAYVGGGLSLGSRTLSRSTESWQGSGLQGELTAGYETARASTIRVFVQLDAGLPFYQITSTTYERTGAITSHERYAPSVTLSIGLGWQRDAHKRP